jgi:capsular polysaccharide biosynthesis protein
VNEIGVINTIKNVGYRLVLNEELSFRQQVQLMLGTNVLLGLHGAGLTNMIFMPAGSVIVEIRKEEDSQNNCFFSLASALGHKYYYVLAKPFKSNIPINDHFSDNVFVDIARLSAVLQLVAEKLPGPD